MQAATSPFMGRARLHQALAQATLRDEEPLILFLDDLQWCDQETLDWLTYLLSFPSTRKLLMISTLRLGQGLRPKAPLSLQRRLRTSGRLEELKLRPLDARATAIVAEALSGKELDPAAAARLFQRTQGLTRRQAAALPVPDPSHCGDAGAGRLCGR
jgi:predicted ATPase